jgi:hypothetical protein
MCANTAENAACTARGSAVQDISCTFLFAPRSSGDTRDTVIGTTVKMEMAVFALSLVQSPASLVRSKFHRENFWLWCMQRYGAKSSCEG